MKLVDGAGTTVPWGETGELMVRSIFRFSEYRGMSEKFAETVDNDNWLRTEDLGIIIVSKMLILLSIRDNPGKPGHKGNAQFSLSIRAV